MRKLNRPIYLVLFLMGGTLLWYFGHHRPAQKALKAAPKRVYKPVVPITQDLSPVRQRSTETPTHEPLAEKPGVSPKTPETSVIDSNQDASDIGEAAIQLPNVEADPQENIASDSTEDPGVSESEERFHNLTLPEIEEKILVLEQEIRTNLTKAVVLYEDLLSTDGMAGKSPGIAAWRTQTWNEVKQLVHDITDTGKMLKYVSYLRVTGRENPMNPGGWLSELMEPLPMQVSIDLTF